MVGDVGDVVQAMAAWLLTNGWWLVAAAVVWASAAWVISRWWRLRAADALQERMAVDLVPSVSFAPDTDEVGWFAGQLARVPAAAGVLPRRASAVRVRLACADGQLAYRVEGPARGASVLRMSAYDGVEVRQPGVQHKVPRIHFEGAAPRGKRSA